MDVAAPLNGLVLAGGMSRRMGSDKGLIVYHDKPQRVHVYDMLAEVCEHVYTSCRSGQHVDARLNPLIDKKDFGSPLNGIVTAFEHDPHKAWLSVAVDLPNISPAVLRTLVSQRDVSKLATCFFDPAAGAPEPLLTIWEPAARMFLLSRAGAGDISPRSFLQHHDVRIIYGMDRSVFENINDGVSQRKWRSRNGNADPLC